MARHGKQTLSQTDPPWPWVRDLEAVWRPGPVPPRYWEYARHRRRFLYWLGTHLGYRTMEDWYRLTTDDFKRNGGAGVLALYWKWSAVEAVKDCFPWYDWKEWRFGMCPLRFWQGRQNHRRY